MRSVTMTFQEVTTYRHRTGKCSVCGKRTKRSRKFEHTVNPFNRNKDGSVKTAEEVRADVNREADAWQPDFDHESCKGVST